MAKKKALKITLHDFKPNHDFSWALTQLKEGRTVRRDSWGGQPSADAFIRFVGDFVVLVPREDDAPVSPQQEPYVDPHTKDVLVEAHFVKGTLAGMWVPGWMPSIPDMLAKNWCLGPKEYHEHPRTAKLRVSITA